MENSGEISVPQALNQIQSWLNAGEFDKVVKGCAEILSVEPGNQRALSLMKQAEGKRFALHVPASGASTATITATASTDANAPTDAAAPTDANAPTDAAAPADTHPRTAAPASASSYVPPIDPLAHLQVERNPEDMLQSQSESDEKREKMKMFLAMLLPAVVVVLLGGGLIWWLANRDREETIDDALDSNLPEDQSYLDENEDRLEDMTALATALEAHKIKTGAYPSAEEIDAALVKSELLSEVPSDSRQGEIDKVGKAFGYIYAVYSGIGGENSVYILSALFEDSKGFGYSWTKGAPIKNYPDYRDYEESNVTFIGGDEDNVDEAVTEFEEQEDDSGPKTNPNL